MSLIRFVMTIALMCTLPVVQAGDAKQPRTAESAVTPFDRNPKRHEAFLERIKAGPVGLLFLGDSITDAWPKRSKETWAKFAPYNPANFGVSGERTEDVLWRIISGLFSRGFTLEPRPTQRMENMGQLAQGCFEEHRHFFAPKKCTAIQIHGHCGEQ